MSYYLLLITYYQAGEARGSERDSSGTTCEVKRSG
jgi:hypothetical protein